MEQFSGKLSLLTMKVITKRANIMYWRMHNFFILRLTVKRYILISDLRFSTHNAFFPCVYWVEFFIWIYMLQLFNYEVGIFFYVTRIKLPSTLYAHVLLPYLQLPSLQKRLYFQSTTQKALYRYSHTHASLSVTHISHTTVVIGSGARIIKL